MGTLYVNNLFPTTGSTVQLNGDVTVVGTTPTLTIGDAGAEDAMLSFSGAAQRFHVALDDTADDLVIGVGVAAGTTTAIAINELAQVQVVDAFAANTAGTFGTFADGDATPSVATGNLWKHHASSQTITNFDDGIAGQTITVLSTDAITYDVTSTNLKGGSTDIVTAAGDMTTWTFDGTNWYLQQFMDVSDDMGRVAGDITGVTAGVGLSGGGSSGDVTLTLDLSELSAVTPTASDSFSTLDSDGATEQRTTITALGTFQAGSNGGLVSTTGVLSVSGSAIAAAGLNPGADEIVFLDADGSIKKSTVQAALGEINADDGGLTASGGQLIISGSNISSATVAVATDEVLILDSDGSIKRESIADLASGMAGTGLDASSGQLTVDLSEVIASDGANELLTSDGDGTATGESNLTYDGSTFVINDDARINDDLPLFFGTSNEAFIKYDEAGQDMLIISGSTFGTTLSGSLVRVVDKLSVGIDVDSAKSSGILMVSAAAADTTNGLVASFKSSDSDYSRINIDNSTANGDTQLTFMSNGSSKWSVGNRGSDENFHIKSGFADFTDTDALILDAATGLSLNTIVTASSALVISDNKKLYFGDVHESHIEYDEDLSDYLIISGSHLGLALSGSNVGISGDTVHLNASAGSIDIDSADNVTVDAADEITLTTTSADGHITLASAHTAGVAFYLSGNAHPGSIVDIDAGIFDVDALGAISLDSSGGSIDINVVDGQTVNIGLNGGVEQIIAPHGTAGSELYSVINTAGTTDGSDAAGAILLSSVAGGIGLAWADGKDLWAEGGRAVITANENAADCIKLHADAGASQTITVVNDAGTGPTAVGLTSTLGGITLNAAAVSTIQDLVTVAPFSTVSYGTDGMYGGNVIKYSPGADDTLTVGGIYFLHTDGTWNATDADAASTGGSQLLGIGLGNARSAGVFTRGLIRIPSTEILNLPGSGACDGLPVYISTTAAHLDFTPPSASGDFVRIVGYAIDDNGSDVLINFDPDSTMVLIS